MKSLKELGEIECACGCGDVIRFEDRKGQAVRHLVREEFYLRGHNTRGKPRPKLWKPVLCHCGCGGVIATSTNAAKGRKYLKGHFRISPEHKNAVSRAQSKRPRRKWTWDEKVAWAGMQRKIAKHGPDNPAWKGKGGIDPSKALRRTPEYKAWREAVFKRDNWTCQICSKRGNRLHPHHNKPISTHPKLIFKTANGKTLCVACHTQLHKKFRPWQ